MRKKLIFIGILLLLVFLGYSYLYQDHRDIQKEQAEFVLSSKKISQEFIKNSTTAEEKYLNKTIEISGLVTEIDKKTATIDETIFCLLKVESGNSIKLNESIKIKGRFIGYDDLLEQVKLDQCSVINKTN